MAYRDPELSRIASELLQEKTKNLILEEENSRLKAMIKAEIAKEPEHRVPVVLSFWRNIACNWVGNHHYEVEVDEPAVLEAIEKAQSVFDVNGELRAGNFGRTEFFHFCRISCKHCGWVEKEFQQTNRETSLGAFLEIVALVNGVFDEFRAKNVSMFKPMRFGAGGGRGPGEF
jgi:hypothetical protein